MEAVQYAVHLVAGATIAWYAVRCLQAAWAGRRRLPPGLLAGHLTADATGLAAGLAAGWLAGLAAGWLAGLAAGWLMGRAAAAPLGPAAWARWPAWSGVLAGAGLAGAVLAAWLLGRGYRCWLDPRVRAWFTSRDGRRDLS